MSTKRFRNDLKTVGMDTPRQEEPAQMPSLVNVVEKLQQTEQAENQSIVNQMPDSTVMFMHLLVPAEHAVAWLDKHLDGKCPDEKCLITGHKVSVVSVIQALKMVGSSPRFGLMLIHTILNQENEDLNQENEDLNQENDLLNQEDEAASSSSADDDDDSKSSDDDEDEDEDEEVAGWITVEKKRIH